RAEHIVLFLGRDVELVERSDEMLHRRVPILFRDAEARVRGLHVAADVDARAARRRAELIDDKLPYALERVGAVPGEKARELRIADQPSDKIVADRGNCVVAAEPL